MTKFPYREHWHETWLRCFENLATEYFAVTYGQQSCNASMIEIKANSDINEDHWIEYNTLGTFELPVGSLELMIQMARFAKTSLTPDPDKLEKMPDVVFDLGEILRASFPKNVKTDAFKSTNGGIYIGYGSMREALDCLGSEGVLDCTFSGLGVMLMKKCRLVLNPAASDEDIMEAVDGLLLGIWEA